jgi:hypothetical protein
VFSDKHVDSDVEKALAEDISVAEFERRLTERRRLFFQVSLVCTVLFSLVLGIIDGWWEKLWFPMVVWGSCFGLQKILLVFMSLGWLDSTLVSLMCGVNCAVAALVCSAVSGNCFFFIWNASASPFFALMLGGIVGIRYAWLYFTVMWVFSVVLPKDIFGFGKPLIDMEFLAKVCSLFILFCGMRYFQLNNVQKKKKKKKKSK